jgi:hypothetical protein
VDENREVAHIAVRTRLGDVHLDAVNVEGLPGLDQLVEDRHLIVGELRPRLRAPGRIADHRGEIADDQNRLVPKVLELPELS